MIDINRLTRPVVWLAVLVFTPAVLAQTDPPAKLVDAQDVVKATTPASELSPRHWAEMRGDINMAKKMYGDAIVSYHKALQIEPRSAVVLNKIGIAYHQQMQLNQAKKYYDRSVKADKTYAAAVNNVGMVYYNKKKWNSAAKEFAKALALKPEMAPVESNLGHALFEMKKYEEAFGAFNRAIALDAEIFERRSGHAGSLLQQRSVENRGFYFFFLAKAFAAKGDASQTAQYLRKARDEGYKGLQNVEKDPAFAAVVKDPLVQELLEQTRVLAQTPRQ